MNHLNLSSLREISVVVVIVDENCETRDSSNRPTIKKRFDLACGNDIFKECAVFIKRRIYCELMCGKRNRNIRLMVRGGYDVND